MVRTRDRDRIVACARFLFIRPDHYHPLLFEPAGFARVVYYRIDLRSPRSRSRAVPNRVVYIEQNR